MNIEQLEVFVYCAHLKSVNQASKALFISQPTATARLQALESALGKQLFDRQKKQIILNQNGQQFLKYAQQILQLYQEGKDQLFKDRHHDQIKLGANVISSQYLLPKLLEQVTSSNSIEIQSEKNVELTTRLLNKEVDVAIIYAVDNEQILQRQILRNKIELVVHPTHRFAQMERVEMQDFIDEHIVFFECGAFDWNLVYNIFDTNATKLKVKYQVDHFEVAKGFIKNNLAIGFLPELAVFNEVEKGELKVVHIERFPQLTQPLYLSILKGTVQHPSYESLASLILGFEKIAI